VQSLSGSNINSICKGCNNESWAISEVFITIVKSGISNSDYEIFFSTIEDSLELRLPVEVINSANFQGVEVLENISRVSIHSNKTHDLLSHWLLKFALYHDNQALQGILLFVPALLHGVLVLGEFTEGLFTVNNP
jgi:hypothetical protein